MTATIGNNTAITSWMVSSDSHIVEPPDLWTGRLPKTLEDRGPMIVDEADGGWWYIDGYKTMSFLGTQTGVRFDKDPDKLSTSGTSIKFAPRRTTRAPYIAESADDGVWGSVIYPSQGLVLFSVPNTEVVSASMKAYNDWLAEFCREDTARLKGIAMVNVDDIDDATAELERCRDLGLAGALITVAPPAWAPFRSRDYDRSGPPRRISPCHCRCMWAPTGPIRALVRRRSGSNVKEVPPAMFINKDYQVRLALGDLILSGVFERFPGCGSAASSTNWPGSRSSSTR